MNDVKFFALVGFFIIPIFILSTTTVQEIAPVRVYSNANSTLDTTQPTPSHGTEPPSLPPTPANITPPESESGVAYCDFYLPQKLTIKLPSQSFTVDLVSTAYAVSVAIGNVADGPDSCAGVKPDGNYPGKYLCIAYWIHSISDNSVRYII